MRRILPVVPGLLLFAVSVWANPVTWTFQTAAFTDGGTITGSFVYDADQNQFSNINVTTTPGNGSTFATAATYIAYNWGPAPGSAAASTLLFVTLSSGDLTGTRTLVVLLGGAMTNAGGTIPIVEAFEDLCQTPTCNGGIGGRQTAYDAGGSISASSCQVNVKPLSQCFGKPGHWGGESYASTSDTICGAGCAMTSLSMALLNQRLSAFPVNGVSELDDPGHLNDFMKLHSGDYQGTGIVGWTSTVKDLASLLGRPDLLFNTDHWGSSSSADLQSALCTSLQPIVVGVNRHCSGTPCDSASGPCHYVLVTGVSGTDFTIADPCGNPKSNLSQYGTFSIRGFVEDPQGDNSQLDLSIGPSAELLLTDPAGLRTGFDPVSHTDLKQISGSYYSRDSIDSDENDAPITGIVHAMGIRRPSQGTYNLLITGLQLGSYSLTLRAFSQTGAPQPPVSLSGISSIGSSMTVQIQSSTNTLVLLCYKMLVFKRLAEAAIS